MEGELHVIPEPYRTMIAKRDVALAETLKALRDRKCDLESVNSELQQTGALIATVPRRIRRSQIVAAVTASIVTALVLIGGQLLFQFV